MKILGKEAANALSPIIINIAMPCLLLESFQRPFSAQLLKEAGASVTAAVIMYAITIPIAFLYPKLAGIKGPEKGVHRFSLLFSNCGFIGYPMVAAILGGQYIFHTILFNIFFNLTAYSFGAWLIAREGEKKMKLTWKIIFNPNVIATIAGFLMFIFSVKLPDVLYKGLKMTGDTTTPLSMLVIGIVMAQTDPRQVWGQWKIYLAVSFRLIFLPLLTGLACLFFGVRHDLLVLAVIIAAMPAATTASIFSTMYNAAPGEGSALVFMSTLFSMATIPLMVALFHVLKLL